MYMTMAFERGNLACEIGGDGAGLTAREAVHFAHGLRDEFPDAVVAILPSRPSWEGGWPWRA